MCGHFTLKISPYVLKEYFGLGLDPVLPPHWEYFPDSKATWKNWQDDFSGVLKRLDQSRHKILVIDQHEDQMIASNMIWGMIPPSVTDPEEFRSKYSTFNAKAETIEQNRMYAAPYKEKRCLVPASTFYEYSGPRGKRIPNPFSPKDEPIFSFAGLWETWTGPKGYPIETCTIITTEPNDLIKPIHHRMPVILHHERYTDWLDTKNKNMKNLRKILIPYSSEQMVDVGIDVSKKREVEYKG